MLRQLWHKNLNTFVLRAEAGGKMPEYREKYDVVTARAVAALPVLCELCLPFCKEDGLFIAMKSRNADDELADSFRAIELCGGALVGRDNIDISADSVEFEKRSLIIIRKVRKTPKIYPRNFSQISKKPL